MSTKQRNPRTLRREKVTRERAVEIIRKHADAGQLVVIGRGRLPLDQVLPLADAADAFHLLTLAGGLGMDLALTTSGSPAATRVHVDLDVLFDF